VFTFDRGGSGGPVNFRFRSPLEPLPLVETSSGS
jgi:hypothetical protein